MTMEQHPFFQNFNIEKLSVSIFDQKLSEFENELVGIFFWGKNCPNCEVAKNALDQEIEQLAQLNFKWFHVNVYESFELGTRFGLHGIPTFLFFLKGKKLGRISPFPGSEPFFEALRGLKEKC